MFVKERGGMMINEKGAPGTWLFRVFFGDDILYPVMWGLFHEPF